VVNHAGREEILVTKVEEILAYKGDEVCTVSPEQTVREALKTMADKNVGALIVLDGDDVVGIVSERDYARKAAAERSPSDEKPVRTIMSGDVVYVRPSHTVEEAMALMTDKHIRHLPVFEGDRLVGLVSIGDLVKASIAEKDFVIEQLESYIRGALR